MLVGRQLTSVKITHTFGWEGMKPAVYNRLGRY